MKEEMKAYEAKIGSKYYLSSTGGWIAVIPATFLKFEGPDAIFEVCQKDGSSFEFAIDLDNSICLAE